MYATTDCTSAGDSFAAGMSLDSPFDAPPPVMTSASHVSERLPRTALSVKSGGFVVK